MNLRHLTPRELIADGSYSSVGDQQLFHISAGDSLEHLPVVFLHGIPTWSWLWREVVAETGAWTRAVAVDLPGFGMSSRSSRQDFRVTTTADTIEHFLDQVFGQGCPVALVVHDFGALVGAELISRSPGRFPALVVTNTSLRDMAWSGGLSPLSILSVPGLGQLSMWLARPWMLRLAMRPFVSDPSARSGNRFAGYWYPFQHGFGQTLARFYQQRPVEPGDFERWRIALTAYPGKSLILWGGRDPAFTLTDFQDIAGLLTGAESTIFEQTSHFLPEELPIAVGRRIRAFLTDARV